MGSARGWGSGELCAIRVHRLGLGEQNLLVGFPEHLQKAQPEPLAWVGQCPGLADSDPTLRRGRDGGGELLGT